jgi:hypothetical protein
LHGLGDNPISKACQTRFSRLLIEGTDIVRAALVFATVVILIALCVFHIAIIIGVVVNAVGTLKMRVFRSFRLRAKSVD